MNPASEPIYRAGIYSPAKAWRERHGRYRLRGSRCEECGALYFPRIHTCAECGSGRIEAYECARTGTVISGWSPPDIITPTGFSDNLPRYVVLIRLDDGVCVKAEVIDLREEQLEPVLENFAIKKPKTGLRVSMVIRKLRRESTGNWLYGFKFVPGENL